MNKPNNSTAQSESSESKILKAAEKLFVKQGFAATTTAQISKEAGCNSALLHYYYRSKEILFAKVFELKLESLIRSLKRGADQSDDNFIDAALSFVGAQFDGMKANAATVRFFVREIASTDKKLQDTFVNVIKEKLSAHFASMGALLEADLKSGKVRAITFPEFLMNSVSLNMAPFIIEPVYRGVFAQTKQQYDEMLERRKEEILQLIRLRLTPQ